MTLSTPAPQIVLVPGLQGHWQWMKPTVRALERVSRVSTFSLYAATERPYFDAWARIIDATSGQDDRIVLVGVSFGGVVASYYAARRPSRVSALILANAPSSRWRLDAESARYLRSPRVSFPLFAFRALRHLAPEVRAAIPFGSRARFAVEHACRVARWPFRASAVAEWVQEWMATDFSDELRRIEAPTLVVTGERALDRVVPVDSSLDYLTLIPRAKHVTLPRTGHLGFLERPQEFARLVLDFAEEATRVGR